MSGYCTFTIYAKVPDEDGGGDRPIPCGKPRIGEVTGPQRTALCKRHYDAVARAMALAKDCEVEGCTAHQDVVHVRLTLDHPTGEMAATAGEHAIKPGEPGYGLRE